MDKPRIVDESDRVFYPIRPEHIDTNKSFLSVFTDNHSEIYARAIVRIEQVDHAWKPFQPDEYGTLGGLEFCTLVSSHYVIIDKDGLCRVTHEFVCRCFSSLPALSPMDW